ncbi:MAG: HNH endonuclease, partial [Gammaproteobacteria bacterium]
MNQNQTYAHEVGGGYLWSPKRKSDGSRNRFYDAMRIVSPGDVIFSFSDTYIKAFGIANSHCYEFPKPWEFGTVGENWSDIGWRVDVDFRELHNRAVRPKDFIGQIRPLLPERYSPLNSQGNGYQHVYLAELPEQLTLFLAQLIDRTVLELVRGNYTDHRDYEWLSRDRAAEEQIKWERRIEQAL